MSTERSRAETGGEAAGEPGVGVGWRVRVRDRLALRNWRVPTRLTALILAPTLVGVALAGARVRDSINSLDGYQRIRSTAGYSGDLRDLAQALALERDKTIWYRVARQQKSALTSQKKIVDGLLPTVRADLGKIDSTYGARAAEDATQIGSRLNDLPKLRGTAQSADYDGLIAAVLTLNDEIAEIAEDPELVGESRALASLAHAKEEVSKQRATLIPALMGGHWFTADDLERFIAARSQQRGRIDSFSRDVKPLESGFFAVTVAGEKVIRAELTKSWAIALAGQNLPLQSTGVRATAVRQWFDDNTETINRMHTVEQRVAGSVDGRSRALQSEEQRNAWVASGLILALLLLVLATTILIARSMVRPLRKLRAEALEIAGYRLPDVVRRMRESTESAGSSGSGEAAEPVVPETQPIGLGTRDEIGEVARAFDEVHRQAVRLAAEESRVRGNVNAMFVNLSRRTQTLVERQISLIDGLERGEQDGERLANLFTLDHLATRMRRNSENLLVLAGHDSARKRSRPARLMDVVRASLSEVEDYERVTIQVQRAVAIVGHATNDVVHLIAELVENALAFSPRESQVVVSSSRYEGGVLLAIGDSGIGIPAEEMAELNRRLSEPPTVDVSVSRRMGLFVVARLALRHHIQVQLRPGQSAGVIAMVLFPPDLMATIPGPAASPSTGTFARPVASATGATAAISAGATGAWSSSPSGAATDATDAIPAIPATPWMPAGAATGATDAIPAIPATPWMPAGAATGAVSDRPIETPSSPRVNDRAIWSAPILEGGILEGGTVEGSSVETSSVETSSVERRMVEGSSVGSSTVASNTVESATDRLPSVQVSPWDREDDFLPIFASVESAWFQRPDIGNSSSSPSSPSAYRPPSPSASASPSASPSASASPSVSSAASRPVSPAGPRGGIAGSSRSQPTISGAQAAQAAQAARISPPASADAAGSGGGRGDWARESDSGWRAAEAASDPSLGGITQAGLPKRRPRANLVPGSAGKAAPSAPRPPISAEQVRSRLASFQEGVRRGRADVAEAGMERSDLDGEDL